MEFFFWDRLTKLNFKKKGTFDPVYFHGGIFTIPGWQPGVFVVIETVDCVGFGVWPWFAFNIYQNNHQLHQGSKSWFLLRLHSWLSKIPNQKERSCFFRPRCFQIQRVGHLWSRNFLRWSQLLRPGWNLHRRKCRANLHPNRVRMCEIRQQMCLLVRNKFFFYFQKYLWVLAYWF